MHNRFFFPALKEGGRDLHLIRILAPCVSVDCRERTLNQRIWDENNPAIRLGCCFGDSIRDDHFKWV